MIIPRSAIFRGETGSWQGSVVQRGIARLADLTIGLGNDFEVEVLDGLQQGDQVIVAPEASQENGQRVESNVR